MLTWRDEDARAMLGEPHAHRASTCSAASSSWPSINEGRPQLDRAARDRVGGGHLRGAPVARVLRPRYEYVYALFRAPSTRPPNVASCGRASTPRAPSRTVIALLDGLQLQWLLHRDERRHGRRAAALPAAAADRRDLAKVTVRSDGVTQGVPLLRGVGEHVAHGVGGVRARLVAVVSVSWSVAARRPGDRRALRPVSAADLSC